MGVDGGRGCGKRNDVKEIKHKIVIDCAKLHQPDRKTVGVYTVKGYLVVQGDQVSWSWEESKATRFLNRYEVMEELKRLKLDIKYSTSDIGEA
jgi:hypothetical protein